MPVDPNCQQTATYYATTATTTAQPWTWTLQPNYPGITQETISNDCCSFGYSSQPQIDSLRTDMTKLEQKLDTLESHIHYLMDMVDELSKLTDKIKYIEKYIDKVNLEDLMKFDNE